MKHSFVWKLQVSEPEKAQLIIWDALERFMILNRHMSNAHVEAGEDHCLIRFHFEGRDRWWVHSRAKYAAMAICVRVKVHPKNLELVQVDRVDSGHDLRKPNRTEAQQEADLKKTKHYKWSQFQAEQENLKAEPLS